VGGLEESDEADESDMSGGGWCIWALPPDREPSWARSSRQRWKIFKPIPSRCRARTRCEPRTARGPILFGLQSVFEKSWSL